MPRPTSRRGRGASRAGGQARAGKSPATSSSTAPRSKARSQKRRSGLATRAPRSRTIADGEPSASASHQSSNIDAAYHPDDDNVEIPQARLHTVPESIAKKWVPISAATKNLFESTMDAVLRTVLGGFSGSSETREEAESHLLELKRRITDAISKTKGPPPSSKRKNEFSGMPDAVRQQEESLLNSHTLARRLETELRLQKGQLTEDEAHLNNFMQSMQSSVQHAKKQQKKNLHPLLRNVDLESANNVDIFTPLPMREIQDVTIVDEDIHELEKSVHERLVALGPKVHRAHTWLGQLHRLTNLGAEHMNVD